jgi:hypothetical protein
MLGYASDKGFAPAINSTGIGDYLAAHTLILAHARVYHLYDEVFRSRQRGTARLQTKTCSKSAEAYLSSPNVHSLHDLF